MIVYSKYLNRSGPPELLRPPPPDELLRPPPRIIKAPPPALPKLWMAVYPSNMAPIRLKLCQNAFQTIPDISFFDAENENFFEFVCKLWTSVYPPRMAPFGLKLWENAFQMIPDISFFDAGKKKSTKNFVKRFFANYVGLWIRNEKAEKVMFESHLKRR